jgi:cytoskeletal protein RodZ
MNLGSLIAKAREGAALSIEDLAGATSIRPALLRDIESNDFSHCGGQTYARGHIRNIAKCLNADETEFLRIYEEEQAIEKRTMHDLLVENNIMRKPTTNRKVSWKSLVVISIASLGIAGVAQIVVSNISTVEKATIDIAAATDVATIQPTVEASVSASASATISTSSSQSPTPTPSEQSSFSTGIGVKVVINAVRAKSWLFVSDAAGRTLFSGQMSMGATHVFTSDNRLDFKVGNAGGVDVEVNGKKLSSIGPDGAVVSVSYGANS